MFPEIYRATVSAGEQSGRLDNVLERLADYTESRDQMRQKVIGATAVPDRAHRDVLRHRLAACWCMWFRRSISVFEASHGKLPLITRALITTSNFLRDYGIWLLIAIVGASFLFVRHLRNPAAQRRFHRRLLRPSPRRQADAWFQHCPVHAHAEHSDGERGSRAGGAANCQRSRDQPAHARCGDGSDAACAGRRAHRALARRQPPVPAVDAFTLFRAASRAASSRTCSSVRR